MSGVVANASFSRSGDIVTDNVTGLEWQDNSDAKDKELKWREAIDYCEALNLGGYSDWRLPNINELKSIVDRDRYNPAIVSKFTNISSNYYWSSSTHKYDLSNAWRVNFKYGSVSNLTKDYSHYVRCVRAGE